MDLFQLGKFILHSGSSSGWKVECDSLSQGDWEALALIASERLPPFGSVAGVPFGGLVFAKALRTYITSGPLLIADDVSTTGASLEKYRAGREAIGVVAFCRGVCPLWVIPLWTLAPERHSFMIPKNLS